MRYEVNLLVTQNAKVRMDINHKGDIYIEIFRKIGETEKNGKKLPIFYDRGRNLSDSRTMKLNVNELATIKRGLRIFIDEGLEAFQKYAARVMGNEKYNNLLFPHQSNLVGLRAYKGKNGKEYIGFEVQDGETNERYNAFTSDLAVLEGIYEKLTFLLGKSLENKTAVSRRARPETEVDEEEEIGPRP